MFSSFSRTKDILKKLVFALEQENLSTRDSLVGKMIDKSKETHERDEISKSVLDDFGFSVSKKKDKSKNMDFLFIKRLMYIKMFVDELAIQHDESDTDELASVKPATSKTLFQGRKSTQKHMKYTPHGQRLSSYSSMIDSKTRISTSRPKHRKNEYSSMSPLKIIESGTLTQQNTKSINLKNHMYSNSIISNKEETVNYAKAHMNFLKSKIKFKRLMHDSKNEHHNSSNKVLKQDYSNDELYEESLYLTQQHQRMLNESK